MIVAMGHFHLEDMKAILAMKNTEYEEFVEMLDGVETKGKAQCLKRGKTLHSNTKS